MMTVHAGLMLQMKYSTQLKAVTLSQSEERKEKGAEYNAYITTKLQSF